MKTVSSDRKIHPGWNGRGGGRPNKVAKPRLPRFSDSRQHKILVPMDFTEASDRALDYALSLADCLGASVVLLHIVERKYAEGLLDTPAKSRFRVEAHDEAMKRLDAIVEKKSSCLAPIQRIVCSGIVQLEILQLAEKLNVALIVIGRPRRNLLGRWFWGSVSDDIIEIAPCPVLVVKQHGLETRPLPHRTRRVASATA